MKLEILSGVIFTFLGEMNKSEIGSRICLTCLGFKSDQINLLKSSKQHDDHWDENSLTSTPISLRNESI